MATPGDAVVEVIRRGAICTYQVTCKCGHQGKEHTASADAHADRRLHNLTHITTDFATEKGCGKR